MPKLPLPPAGDPPGVEAWVRRHLAPVVEGDEVSASGRFRGGQVAADAALALLDITGYAGRRNEVWPPERRGATALSPYIRHGLIQLPLLWDAVGDAPPPDRTKFRDELLWQEHARHLYARLGDATARGLRRELIGERWATDDPGRGSGTDGPREPVSRSDPERGWDTEMACLRTNVEELVTDGYLVNQTRMWLASHWAVREGLRWQDGEDTFFRHLLDGSRAANRAGWQWTIGTGTGRSYGFSRFQVRKRAPDLCGTCPLRDRCPIEDWPEDPPLIATEEPARLRRDPDVAGTAGPDRPTISGQADAVWLTAESLGDDDPALVAHPQLPVVFVFDLPLLTRLRLSGKRLVFLAESLADLAQRREVHLAAGAVTDELAGRRLAATFAPVPGWRRRSASLDVAAVHPWPWLVQPHDGSIASFSAWRSTASKRGGLPHQGSARHSS